MPVVEPLPASLVADCPPSAGVPAGPIKVGDVLDRLAAVEDALAECRSAMAEVRRLTTRDRSGPRQ